MKLAIRLAAVHFAFDSSVTRRMVCPELMDRCYHGRRALEFPLTQRLGRYTLTADDIVKLSLIMTEWWHRNFRRLCIWIYFSRISVVHPERLPSRGPTLFLGLHRNGAVDGFVYDSVLPHPVFLISTQLRKNFFARLFFNGIAVARTKDEGDRNANREALQQCLNLLRSGGELCIFPEGTSALGPRHLPFKSGAAQVLLEYLERAPQPVQVIPLGIHYECAWAFRSKVEVVVGQPILTDLPTDATPLGKLKTVKSRIRTALEEVGLNVPTDDYQQTIQRLAYVATLATPRSYFKTLKLLEQTIPAPVLKTWQQLAPELNSRRLLRHQDVPLVPMGPLALYAAVLLVLGPMVLAGMAANLPPLVTAWWASKEFPDDRNVVSLWKILAGLPALILWVVALLLLAVITGGWLWLAGYAVVSWLALKCYYRVKKLAVAVHNGFRCPALRLRLLAFRQTLLRCLPNETD